MVDYFLKLEKMLRFDESCMHIHLDLKFSFLIENMKDLRGLYWGKQVVEQEND